ncbi:F-box/LRR-repeat protein At3g26922-like isoform X2 [Magnolia sinica]|uniref:F-box/LRR-repeat protein At3g26922-like isoform X2 n=1 Tax=Magnolia sinica TaxID=86752 RepID=UPI00265940D0|nr:F-box/LRR-repeat protein At3g26922-like isoform X2 [Magnolia sinica]
MKHSLQKTSADQMNMNHTRKRQMRADADDQAADQISNLPEAIRSHIVSMLPMEEAVVTTVLSRSWRHILTSLTTLDFEYSRFPQVRRREQLFIDFIKRTIALHNRSNIEKFRMSFGFYFRYTPLVNEWIGFAVGCNVRELDLDIPKLEDAKLPSCLFTCESLVVLKLNMNDSVLKLPVTIEFCRLKTLHLKWISFSDECLTRGLFSSCPMLEDLNFRSCEMKEFQIFDISSPSLKSLTMFSCGLRTSKLKVSTPNLLSFKYIGYMAQDYALENLSSLTDVDINFFGSTADEDYSFHWGKLFRGLSNARVFRLGISCIGFLSRARDLLEWLPRFCNLKHLKLTSFPNKNHFQAIFCLLESSPNLEYLLVDVNGTEKPIWVQPYTVDWQGYMESRELSLECLEYHLRTVEMRNFHGCDDEVNFVKLLLRNAKVLEGITIAADDSQSAGAACRGILNCTTASSNVHITFPKKSEVHIAPPSR